MQSYTLFMTVMICSASCCLSSDPQPSGDLEWIEAEGASIPVPPPEHPRLYLRQKHISDLKKRMAHPVLKPVWDDLVKSGERGGSRLMELNALRYLLDRDDELGRDTIWKTLKLMQDFTWPHKQDISREIGRMMVTGAIVYDWCYELLKPEQKNAFIEQFIRLARSLECGYPPVRQGAVTGHTSEAMLMRDTISAGIAIYDEFPEMYRLSAGRFFREHVPARNWFYPGHAYHQGDSYGPYRYMWDIVALWIFDRLGAGNVFDPNQQFVPYQYIYAQRPDGQLLRSGDTFRHSTRHGEIWRKYPGFLLSASYYGDGYVYSHYLKAPADSGTDKIFEFLWRDPDLKPLPITDLPLSFYMGTPFGHMIARTGWGEDSAIAEMKINEYNFVNHQHSDAGSFQVYYKGSLAIDSGLYQGTEGAYHSLHDVNYNKRTIAHNCLLIYDPDERFGEIRGEEARNDGGQWRHWGEPRTLEMLLSDGYETGKVLAHAFGPDTRTPVYTYLKGDITRAYSKKVSEVKRSFVFLKLGDGSVPAALIVFDKVAASDPDFKKYWLLHSMEEPQISGNQIIVVRSEHGEQGKLVNTVLLPETDNALVTAVGGPGKEFWVFGRNYPNSPRWDDMRSVEMGAWRVELSPKEPSETDYFLNVIQVMDKEVEQPLQVKRIDDVDVVGVKLADKIVLFNREGSLVKGTIKFSINGEGSVDILVTDLAVGEWQIRKDNTVLIPEIQCQAGEHLIYFRGSMGDYELSLRS